MHRTPRQTDPLFPVHFESLLIVPSGRTVFELPKYLIQLCSECVPAHQAGLPLSYTLPRHFQTAVLDLGFLESVAFRHSRQEENEQSKMRLTAGYCSRKRFQCSRLG